MSMTVLVLLSTVACARLAIRGRTARASMCPVSPVPAVTGALVAALRDSPTNANALMVSLYFLFI